MGGEPYWYFVKYQTDINSALHELRQAEFKAGRYYPVMMYVDFPINERSPAPGQEHESIEEAMEAAGADGTKSILDIMNISDTPNFCVASPFTPETIIELYGTDKPTREMVEDNMDFLADIERGHCIYFVIYKDGKPDEILFAGYSFD